MSVPLSSFNSIRNPRPSPKQLPGDSIVIEIPLMDAASTAQWILHFIDTQKRYHNNSQKSLLDQPPVQLELFPTYTQSSSSLPTCLAVLHQPPLDPKWFWVERTQSARALSSFYFTSALWRETASITACCFIWAEHGHKDFPQISSQLIQEALRISKEEGIPMFYGDHSIDQKIFRLLIDPFSYVTSQSSQDSLCSQTTLLLRQSDPLPLWSSLGGYAEEWMIRTMKNTSTEHVANMILFSFHASANQWGSEEEICAHITQIVQRLTRTIPENYHHLLVESMVRHYILMTFPYASSSTSVAYGAISLHILNTFTQYMNIQTCVNKESLRYILSGDADFFGKNPGLFMIDWLLKHTTPSLRYGALLWIFENDSPKGEHIWKAFSNYLWDPNTIVLPWSEYHHGEKPLFEYLERIDPPHQPMGAALWKSIVEKHQLELLLKDVVNEKKHGESQKIKDQTKENGVLPTHKDQNDKNPDDEDQDDGEQGGGQQGTGSADGSELSRKKKKKL